MVSECAYLKVEFDLALLHKQAKYGLNQRNIARNGIGMQRTIRNDVSHIKFEQIVQKLYTQKLYTASNSVADPPDLNNDSGSTLKQHWG